MIYNHAHITEETRISADVCVVGSGAGGGPVAWRAAQAGLRVVVIEAGSFVRPEDCSQLEHEMIPKLYHDSGGRTTADKAIHVHQGKGVGGSTLHNLNLCARVSPEIFAEWRADYGLNYLNENTLASLYDEAESLLSVSTVTEEQLSANSRILKRGCEALGYAGGMLKHNRVGCAQTGFCELGCPFDGKQNSLKVFIASAVESGTIVLTDTWATHLEWEGSQVKRVHAVTRSPQDGSEGHAVVVEARVVCLSASATGTPAMLKRSDVPDPNDVVGSRIHLHPGAAVAGLFAEQLYAWRGIPQGYECTEHLDFSPSSGKRIWIIPAFAHPAGVSTFLPDFGNAHQFWMEQYSRMAAFSPMIHDTTAGTVRDKGRFGVKIKYWLNEADREQMRVGLAECLRIMLAAGAESALLPSRTVIRVRNEAEIEDAVQSLEMSRHELDITSVHPMSSVWMGDSPQNSCVDSTGRYHHLDNLYVADTSLFPTSTGGPPQLTAYAMGLHVGRHVVASL